MKPNPAEKQRADLVGGIAKAGAHRHAVRAARRQLLDHASEQLDSMAPTIATLEAAVEANAGDILSQRRLRTLLDERRRLQAVLARGRGVGGA